MRIISNDSIGSVLTAGIIFIIKPLFSIIKENRNSDPGKDQI
jgi:hypothetical protein